MPPHGGSVGIQELWDYRCCWLAMVFPDTDRIYRLGFMRWVQVLPSWIAGLCMGKRKNGVEAFVDDSPGEDLNGI